MEIKVLDQGYVQFIESWGSDERIVESARMSTQKGFLGWGPKCPQCGGTTYITAMKESCASCGEEGAKFVPGDEKLLAFLWDKQHATPFEMAGLIIEVKAPIMVFREWHRHRTQSYNEMSARYIPLPDDNYRPDPINVHERAKLAAATRNRQATSTTDHVPTLDEVLRWIDGSLIPAYEVAQKAYEEGLKLGIPKELARLPVPVGRYSCMRASANLRNWMGFLKLRCDTASQWEIRQYSNAVATLLEHNFPRTYEVAKQSLGLP